MRKTTYSFLVAFILVLLTWACSLQNRDLLHFKKMMVDYAESPINIDASQPRFSWILESSTRDQYQSSYRIFLASEKKTLEENQADIWDSGKINSSETIQHELPTKALQSDQGYFWKVIVWDNQGKEYESPVQGFQTALMEKKDWEAKWIGKDFATEPIPEKGFITHRKEEAEMEDTVIHSGQSLLLRKEVNLPKKIKSAKAFVTGLGYYEFYINGKKVGDQVLAPAKTPYHKHILYDTYDVTDLLNEGDNALGFHLGNGWYNPYKPWWKQYRMQWFGHKKAIGQVHISYTDGSHEILKTDETWSYSDGPITFNCIYDGEVYDANLEQSGWNTIDFDDSMWQRVSIYNTVKSRLESQTMPPIKVIETISPKEIPNQDPQKKVFDMEQNFTGWVKIKVQGAKGNRIKIRFAEDILEDGNIDPSSNERAKATAEYILKGEGVEFYEPRFTYFGFRYVEISAEAGPLDLKEIEGCVVHSDNPQVGHFNSSNELVNKLHRATVWSQKSNMLGYPMDCPQRDERLGWFGDAQVTAEEAMFNFDMSLFYENWFEGIKDNQDENSGDIPIISPQPYIWDEGVEWSSTYILMVWDFYRYYKDKQMLASHYPAMKRYLEFLDSIAVDYIVPKGWIGDWGSMVEGWKEGEPVSIPTAFYYFDAKILAKIAGILEKPNEKEYYSQLAKNIRQAYNNKYFNPETGNYTDGSQMANAFPLFLDLAPDGYEKQILSNLVNDIVHSQDNHLTTGVLGTKYMPEALAKYGKEDIAWNIINQKTYPSWNSMMEKYTTTCEFWTLKQSKNHVMMGSIDAWFYKYIAGIQLDESAPAYSRFIISPTLLEGLSHAEASTETIRGRVSSKWEIKDGKFSLETEIPFNTSAKVQIPGKKEDILKEGGKPLDTVKGLEYLGYSNGAHQLEVKSGNYQFTTENK